MHGVQTRSLRGRVNFVHHMGSEEAMDEQLRHYFALEHLTINPKIPQADPEQYALKILDEWKLSDCQYQTAVIEAGTHRAPNNYECAMQRLIINKKKLGRNPELKEKYNRQIKSLIEACSNTNFRKSHMVFTTFRGSKLCKARQNKDRPPNEYRMTSLVFGAQCQRLYM